LGGAVVELTSPVVVQPMPVATARMVHASFELHKCHIASSEMPQKLFRSNRDVLE
jgi:hypothetical protein